MRLGNPSRDRQSKSGAGVLLVQSCEALKDPFPRVDWDTTAVIGDADRDLWTASGEPSPTRRRREERDVWHCRGGS